MILWVGETVMSFISRHNNSHLFAKFLLLCFDVANLSKGRKEDTKQGEERSQG